MPAVIERELIRSAITEASATESIGRRLGDELIAAARDTVGEWDRLNIRPHSNHFRGLRLAIKRLKYLVG